ncbi:MAG: type II secretion system GspH family protein [Campylobacter sp.]|uniref:type II secretion system protein n=1 Tax=Campylobacter sp. TaxID=205 RepID=UPI002A574A98|nr:type II secretion system protein [Campylobacter sp.]MCI6177322.1 type II secretion system GspH family protein [Campylobacter sp.]MDD7090195.1 type II secretion system protein [Campylobacteraceae bacterium]MDY4012119.1 type II secretion system protein [Campylobacter sp.]MDY5284922.1 type II secretion system protein [Campylobacter sp.]
MKKGFTMIELIFVIVILGILASVAIPRLAATREDAEISAAVANLRTLVSDASAYYTAKGEFPNNTKWKDITNVPTAKPNDNVTTSNSLKVGGKECIDFLIEGKNSGATGDKATAPTHILIAKNPTNKESSVCKQVLDSKPLEAYFNSRVDGAATNNGSKGAIAIGSTTSVYAKPTTTSQSN